MNGPSLRPSGKPENPTVQPVLPPQNGAAMPPRTLHPPPGLYPIAQMQEMYNAASQYQYAPPVAHIHNAAHLAAMAPPPAHLLGTHTGMAPIQAMHAMTVPQTHFTQNVSAPAAETIKPPSTKTAQSLVASSPPKDETTNNVSSAASKPVESVNEPDIKSQNSNEEVSSFEKPSDLVPVKSDENGVREDKDKVETSVSEVSSTESETKEENKPTEESVEAETDEKPSENVVATKSIPESTDVTSTPDTTKELEAPQQEKEDVKEEKEVKESPKEEPKEAPVPEIGTVVRPPSPKKTPTKTKAEKKSEVIKPLVIQKKIEKPAKEPKPEVEKASPPKRKRDESAKRVTPPKPDSGSGDDRKSKRARTQTQPFQAALEDLTYLRMVKKLSQPPKATEEKVTIFLKNEFLAVRNPEGSFYVCRTLQDVLRNSHNIKICWMTNDKQPSKDIYVKDYNDKTDFECILTNLTMEKVDKDSFRLPEEEAKRTENILKRALDREKGVVDASITEDNPDGIDVSLIKDSEDIRKRTRSVGAASTSEEDVPDEEEEEERPVRITKKTPAKKTPAKKVQPKTPAPPLKTVVKAAANLRATPKSKKETVAATGDEKSSSSESRRSSKRARPSAVELPPLTDDEFEELLGKSGDSPDDENGSESEGEKKKKKKKSKKKKSKEEKAAKKEKKLKKEKESSEKGEEEKEKTEKEEEEPPAKKAKETKKSKKSKK